VLVLAAVVVRAVGLRGLLMSVLLPMRGPPLPIDQQQRRASFQACSRWASFKGKSTHFSPVAPYLNIYIAPLSSEAPGFGS
jgi:hypothetical protein